MFIHFKYWLIPLCLLSTNFTLFAQGHDSLSFLEIPQGVHKGRLTGVIITETIAYSGLMVGLNALWYSAYPQSSFHFFNDNKQWEGMDKLGHAMTSYYTGIGGLAALRWAGVKGNKAVWYGGNLGYLLVSSIEVLDGLSEEWGASPGDMIANTAGAGLLVGQELAWKEQRITLKFSYHQSTIASLRPNVHGSNIQERVLKDYNGQTYWLSTNIASFMSESSMIPKWINVAVGYGADGVLFGSPIDQVNSCVEGTLPCIDRTRQFYLSLDVDLNRITVKSRFLKVVLGAVGFVKIPFPAIEINSKNGFVFHPFYF